jgi:hypothetical protein
MLLLPPEPEEKMTPSKSKKDKRRRRRRRKRKQKPLENLKRRLEQGPLRGQEFVIEPSGEVKMSEVLTAFVEPYLESADTEGDYRKLLTLAIAAWNISLFPEEEQQDMVDEILETMPATSAIVKMYLREIVNMLIARKKAYFSEHTRMIVGFELTDMGEDYHLSVASTLEVTPL